MKVAAVQHDITWEDPEANFEHLAPKVAQAAADGARLVVLAEMYSTGFSMASDRVAEPPDGPSVGFLADQAAAHDVWVCGSVPVRDPSSANLPYNRFVLAGPDGVAAVYDKIHPFTYGGEQEHYAAGRERLTITVEGVRISPFVCYDLRFSDEFWGLAHDTDCFLVVANWPAARRAHWSALPGGSGHREPGLCGGGEPSGHRGRHRLSGRFCGYRPVRESRSLAQPEGQEAVLYADIDLSRLERSPVPLSVFE